MDLNRRVCVRILFILPLLAHVGTATVLPGIDQSFDCTNDYDKLMFCQLEVKNCAGYSLTLRSNEGYGEKNCTFAQHDSGQCHCSFQIMLVLGETHTATVWKDEKSVENKNFSIRESLKPKTPTISSVSESNGNFQVMWRSHMNGFINDELTAEVTYYKRGDTQKISKLVTPATVEGQQYYEINGKDLHSNSEYVVSVKSYFSGSGKFSDSSTEFKFNTSASLDSQLLPIIICLSIAAVIFSATIYGTYVKFKTNWWDVINKPPNPEFLNFYPSQQKVLKPEPSMTSHVCVEPVTPDDSKQWSKMSPIDTSSRSLPETSGIDTGSSCPYPNIEPPTAVNVEAAAFKAFKDALGKVFPNISPISLLTTSPLSTPYSPCGVRANDTSSGSSVFENITYSIVIPTSENTTDSSEVQVQDEMLCDSEYNQSKTDTVSCPDHQVPTCVPHAQQDFILPPMVSSFMPTDMSYQHCNADSGRFSFAEDSSLSSISSGTNTTDSCDLMPRTEAGFESSNEIVCGKAKLTEKVTTCDENPCYGCVPTGSHSFLAVDDSYKAFPSQVREFSVLVLEQKHDEHEKHSDMYGKDSFTKTPQSIFHPGLSSFINNIQDGQHLSVLQIPFSSLVSADCSVPLITESGYQSV